MENIKTGFVGVIGEPNAGKSTLLNWLVGERIAMVSRKANATRKRLTAITMYKDNQIILIDTPGIHEKERLLNKYMLNEALRGLSDSDLILYIADVRKGVDGYKKFLELNKKEIPHLLVLTKIDIVDNKIIISISNQISYFIDEIYDTYNSYQAANTIFSVFIISGYLSIKEIRDYSQDMQNGIIKDILNQKLVVKR